MPLTLSYIMYIIIQNLIIKYFFFNYKIRKNIKYLYFIIDYIIFNNDKDKISKIIL